MIVKAEGFIWLIIGVFWVIAQIAGAAAKKNQPRPPTSVDHDGRESPVDPMTELLRKLAGGQEFREVQPEPVYETQPEEKQTFSFQNAWEKGDIEKLPDIQPLRRATSEQNSTPVPMPEIDLRPKMSAFRQSVPAIKLPAMTLSFRGLETSVHKATNLGKVLNPGDKNSLRRAILSHIVFSKPKAFEQ